MIKKISIQVILFLMIPMSSLSSLSPRSYQLNNLLKNQKSKVNIAERQAEVQASLKNLILLPVKDYHNLNPLKPKKPWFHSLFHFSKRLNKYRKQVYQNIKRALETDTETNLSPKESTQKALDELSKLNTATLIIIGIIVIPIGLSLCIASIPGLFFLGLSYLLLPNQANREKNGTSFAFKILAMLYGILFMPIIIALLVLILIPIFLWGTFFAIGFILTFLLDILTFIPRKYFIKKEEKEDIPQENFLTLLITNQPLAKQEEFTAFLQTHLQDRSPIEIMNHSVSAQILIQRTEELLKNYQSTRSTIDNLDLVAATIKKLLLMNEETINDSILDLMVTLKLLVENKASQLKDKDRYRMMILHNLLVTLSNAHQMKIFQDKENIINFQINFDESLNIPKDNIDPSIWMNKLRKSA